MTAAAPAPSSVDEHVRRSWKAAHLVPLWESPTAHKPAAPPDAAMHWSWSTIRPLLQEAMAVTSPAAVERRVLSLVNAAPRSADDEATVRTISAALQMLLPGERARPHRHSMNALRFALEGNGAVTVVDGKECPMRPGDLILTPAWTWHEHAHRGDEPVIWLDVLDVPLHLWLGTAEFQPGPVNELPPSIPDEAFGQANLLPVTESYAPAHSPIFRYPYAEAAAAVAAAPPGRDGARRVRYVNPLSGGGAMGILDATLIEISTDKTRPFRTNSNAVCCVLEGQGESVIGETKIAWAPKDIFSLPQNNWIQHRALSDASRLLVVTDRDALQRLGFLKEQYG